MENVQVSDLEELLICTNCVSDAYLVDLIEEMKVEGTCSCCTNTGHVMSLGDMAIMIEKAIDDHFSITDFEPNFMQQMMLKDKEISYHWERDGELASFIANDIIGFADDVFGSYIQTILANKHSDWEMMTMSEPTPFDDEHYYERKTVYPDGMYAEWRTFETIVHKESRYYSAKAKTFLDDVFDGLNDLATHSGESVIKTINPSDNDATFFRGRFFFKDEGAIKAMTRPDVEIGPPPANLAIANRMNAKGVSVFYGATSIPAAIAEIRPPIGSTVIMGGFKPLRAMRLLDLKALNDIPSFGSLLDPSYLRHVHRAHFFKSLVRKMTRPIDPSNPDTEYLTTQVIADYLQNIPGLEVDGILFPSSQHSGQGINVVLFHKSSRVQIWDIPDYGRATGSIYQQYADQEFELEPRVTLWIPHDHEDIERAKIDEQERVRDMFGGTQAYDPIPDGRMYVPVTYEPSLSIQAEDVTLHEIRAIDMTFNEVPVKRNTYIERPPGKEPF